MTGAAHEPIGSRRPALNDITIEISYGYCHCKCGRKTKVSPLTRSDRGWIAGVPRRYILGHHPTQPRIDFSDAAPFRIEGIYCKLIDLTKGWFAIVWQDDYVELSQRNWTARRSGKSTCWYASANLLSAGHGQRKNILMHKHLCPVGDGLFVDHENRNSLDNRRSNLRPVTQSQNSVNAKLRTTNKSGQRGVCWENGSRKWLVQFRYSGKLHKIGKFDDFDKACEAYREATTRILGGFKVDL